MSKRKITVSKSELILLYEKESFRDAKERIEVAKISQKFPKMSLDELAIIHDYTVGGFAILNPQLGSLIYDNYTIAHKKLLNQALDKLPSYKGEVYRRKNLNKTQLQRYLDAIKSKEPITEVTFISTSYTYDVMTNLYEVKGNAIFVIQSKTGKNIEQISMFGTSFPENEQEHEVLFKSYTKFNVLDSYQNNDLTFIEMEEI